MHRAIERVPVMGLLERLYRAAPRLRRLVYRVWYRQMTRFDKTIESPFANYGFAHLNGTEPPVLDPADEPDRLSIQLYHHVSSAVPIVGRDVLEIGSGRGGGASYVARYLKPRVTVGLDLNSAAIACCKRRFEVPGLSFRCGDGEALPYPDGSYDVVVNVESSHCYGSMKRFLGEVARVLRPDGHLLLADFRAGGDIAKLRDEFGRAGFVVEREERITPNVFRALQFDNARKLELIRRRVPSFLQAVFRQFAATSGTPTWEKFRRSHWEYYSFVLSKNGRKPAA